MATVTIEIGKLNSKGLRPVTFLICHDAKKRRIPSGVYVSPSELTKKGRIKKVPLPQVKIEEVTFL